MHLRENMVIPISLGSVLALGPSVTDPPHSSLGGRAGGETPGFGLADKSSHIAPAAAPPGRQPEGQQNGSLCCAQCRADGVGACLEPEGL